MKEKFRKIHDFVFIVTIVFAGGSLAFASDGELAQAGANSKAEFSDKVRFTQGGFVNKDGKIQMDNSTAKFSDKIQYTGGDLEVKGLSGVNAALVLFYDKETPVESGGRSRVQ